MDGEKTIREILRQADSFGKVEKQFDEFEIEIKKAFEKKYDEILFLGCGTSFYLAATLTAYFEKYNDISAKFIASYDFYLNTENYINKNKKYLIVPLTRVASTTETYKAVNKGRTYENVKSLAITCDEFSYDYNDYVLYIKDMFEESIVMTSSYSTMLYVGMLLSAVVSKNEELERLLRALPSNSIEFIKETNEKVKKLAKDIYKLKLFVGLGTGNLYGLAGEASIKLKEMCLVPTEVFSTLEYRHGPISICNEDAVYAVFVEKNCVNESLALIRELKEKKAKVIGFGAISKEIDKICDMTFKNMNGGESSLPALIVPIQLMGAYVALEKKLNPDVPRGLTKAVIL